MPGATNVGGMCQFPNSVSICEDNGLMVGKTLAHETGHSWVYGKKILHDSIMVVMMKMVVHEDGDDEDGDDDGGDDEGGDDDGGNDGGGWWWWWWWFMMVNVGGEDGDHYDKG